MRIIQAKEVREFAESIVDEATILATVQWISANMTPEDVFSEEELSDYAKDWATDNGWADPSEAHPHWDQMTPMQKDEAIKKSY